jgi:uncharacterized damage-inducible protein DinB
MDHLLLSQYEGVKCARQALFSYCVSMNQSDLFEKIAAFNNNCIVDLLVHNANTYISWLKNFGMDAALPFYETEDMKYLNDIKLLFEKVDLIVGDFLQKYKDDYEQLLTKEIKRKGITVTLTPLQLFTHVITHEFHHKGQMLTMSRLLGYTPADTDVIRT